MTLMFRVPYEFLLREVGTGEGRIFFFENDAEIMMYRHLEGFLLKSIYVKKTDEETLIFVEHNLGSAVRVFGVENDPEMERAGKAETDQILRQILGGVLS